MRLCGYCNCALPDDAHGRRLYCTTWHKRRASQKRRGVKDRRQRHKRGRNAAYLARRKARRIARAKERYHNDPVFRERRLTKTRIRYRDDPVYREYHKAYAKQYHRERTARLAGFDNYDDYVQYVKQKQEEYIERLKQARRERLRRTCVRCSAIFYAASSRGKRCQSCMQLGGWQMLSIAEQDRANELRRKRRHADPERHYTARRERELRERAIFYAAQDFGWLPRIEIDPGVHGRERERQHKKHLHAGLRALRQLGWIDNKGNVISAGENDG